MTLYEKCLLSLRMFYWTNYYLFIEFSIDCFILSASSAIISKSLIIVCKYEKCRLLTIVCDELVYNLNTIPLNSDQSELSIILTDQLELSMRLADQSELSMRLADQSELSVNLNTTHNPSDYWISAQTSRMILAATLSFLHIYMFSFTDSYREIKG